MSPLRRWQLSPTDPHSLTLAADARFSSTDYTDDQIWELTFGQGETPALALQTRYGGRAGLVSIVPMWVVDNRTVYQTQGYARAPVVTAFAPGFIQAQGRIVPQVALRAEYWAIESHVAGARYILVNAGKQPVTLHLNIFSHIIAKGREQPVRHVDVGTGAMLHFANLPGIAPVVALEKGRPADDGSPTPKLTTPITLQPGERITVRWVHAALPGARDSLNLAEHWLKQDWEPQLRRIDRAASHTPDIETSDPDLDAAVALSYREVVGAFLRPTQSLPHPSFVAIRRSDRGFSAQGDGADHIRSWNGQLPTLAYLTALGVAPVSAALAQGIIRNYLAVQQSDGWIDFKPGLAGQRYGLLCLPILARLTWSIFQYTEDVGFLSETFPGLLQFFRRWLQADLDSDGDGLPEWQAEAQTGYPFFPSFAIAQPWGQQANIRTVESPDLIAYLLSEAASLREIAFFLRDSANEQRLAEDVTRLQAALEALWRGDRYAYRDRDTHLTTGRTTILEHGDGDQEHIIALPLDPPNRLVVRVEGGLEHVPRMTLHVHGVDHTGQPIHETADSDDFVWTHTRGVYTTQRAFSQLDRLHVEGLIRAYQISAHTLDTTRRDITALLPLWSAGVPSERAEALMAQVTDPAQFWQPNGVTMTSAQDPQFDPANASGSGGIWPFWLTIIGEGLIEHGQMATATHLLKRLLAAQVAVLKAQKEFGEFYHAAEPVGLGERGHLSGIVPLHLLLRVLGVRVINSGLVWTGGPFTWGSSVTITHRGVRVTRSAEGTEITFPSGHAATLPPDAPWQEVRDPTPKPPARKTQPPTS